MHLSRRAFMASASAAAICLLNKEAFAALHGSIPIVPTVPFVQEVTVAAPDIIRVEIRDPLIQKGTVQYLGSSFAGTDQVWTTATNPNPAPQINVAQPLGFPGELLTLRFDDIPPSSWFNRLAGDVAGNWSVTGLTVTAIARKTYPWSSGQSHSTLTNVTASYHRIWLKLSAPLVSGTTYTITPPAATGFSPITLAFNDKVTRACSLLVNQAGHRAGDDLKLSILSGWIPGFPNEGALEFESTYGINSFNIIDKTGTVVYSAGTFSQRLTPTQLEVGDSSNNGSVSAASWAATGSGQITYTVPNRNSPGDTVLFTGFTPSGYNGSFTVVSATSTSIVVASASNPGTATVNGSIIYPRIYRSASQAPIPITGINRVTNTFTTSNPSAPPNGTLVQMQGFGAGVQLTNMVWSSTGGGQVTFTGANSYAVGQHFTVSQAAPAGFNGTFQAISGTNSSQLVAAMASNPGSASVMGVVSNAVGTGISIPGANGNSNVNNSGNVSGTFVVANSSGQTFTLNQVSIPSGVAGSAVSLSGWGPWGPGTYLTAAVAQAIGADDNFGNGFDSFFQPCNVTNRAGTYVYGLDYSTANLTTLPESGAPYRVQIPGLGVSDPIQITEGSWYNNAWNWMKGFYHQTSGAAIDGRFGYSRQAAQVNGLNGCVIKTSFLPMAFTSEDGGYSAAGNFSGDLDQAFAGLTPFLQSTVAPAGVFGAYHDSGDWCSVLYYHWGNLYTILDLGYEFCGGTTASMAAAKTVTYNFPRASTFFGSMYSSIDTMADEIHCAIYFAEFYRLNQDAFGAVPSGTSFGDIGAGDGSDDTRIPSSAWSVQYALNAPDHPSGYGFACLAAKIAIQLFNFLGSETALVTAWVNAAVNSWNWCEGIWAGLLNDPQFYYGATAYNGTALNFPQNTIAAILQYGVIANHLNASWTASTTGTTVNGVGSLGTISSSSDFGSNNTYPNITLTSNGSGTGMTATIVVSGGKVSKVLILNPGNNNAVNDVLSCNLTLIGGGTSFSVPVASLTQTTSLDTAIGAPTGPVSSSSIVNAGTGGIPNTYPGVVMTGGTGSGAVATIVIGAGGTASSVTFTSKGKGFVYGDLLTASPGGLTNLSVKVTATQPSPSNSLNFFAFQNRTNAAGALFRLMGVLGQSQTTYANAFQSGGAAIGQNSTPGIWEVLNAPNNTALKTFLTSINWPTSWSNLVTSNTGSYTIASGTNAYFTMSGGIQTSLNYINSLYAYVSRVIVSGLNPATDATCINIRKMICGQMGLTLGANETGLCFATGIGARNTLGILHRDWESTTRTVSGFQPPPAGITPYGLPNTIFPTGVDNFSTDSPANFTVILPTGNNESTNGSKRIITPHHQCLPMWSACVENSYCILTMEFQDFGQWVGLYCGAKLMWCWDGNSSKT